MHHRPHSVKIFSGAVNDASHTAEIIVSTHAKEYIHLHYISCYCTHTHTHCECVRVETEAGEVRKDSSGFTEFNGDLRFNFKVHRQINLFK